MRFFIQGPAYPKHKVGNGVDGANKWSDAIIEATKDLPKISGPCRMKVDFLFPSDRFSLGYPYGPDLDNLTKRLLDALKLTILNEAESGDGCVIKLEISEGVTMDNESIGTNVEVELEGYGNRKDRFLYFAYGSNMHQEWLSRRVNIPINQGKAFLPGYKLRANKLSKNDNSGKANIEIGASSDIVWGVIWSIEKADLERLDHAEGFFLGVHDGSYKRIEIVVFNSEGIPSKVSTYIACGRNKEAVDIPMYDWYVDLIRRGASGNSLPESYIAKIERFEIVKDQVEERSKENLAIAGRWPLPIK